jgi:DNA repair protein RadC
MGSHDRHRQRVKERFRWEGLDHFAAHEVIELLLFFGIPQGEVNGLAHELVDRFGGIAGILDAGEDELLKVKGVGPHTAMLFSIIPQLFRRYRMDKNRELILRSSAGAGEYLVSYYIGRQQETVVLITLDALRRVTGTHVLHKGSMSNAELNAQLVLKQALVKQAPAVILAHNHPAGVALPSEEDKSATAHIKGVLRAAGIELSDHIIVADNDYVSFSESGWI